MGTNENINKINWQIDLLKSGHWNMLKRDYKAFWNHVKEINELFKTLSPLPRDERNDIWKRLNVICEDVKRQQNREVESAKYKSKNHRDYIFGEARTAELFHWPAPSVWDVNQVKDLGAILKKVGQYFTEHKVDMIYEHKQECYERLKEISEQHTLWWGDHKKKQLVRHEDFRTRVKNNIYKNQEKYNRAADTLRNMESNKYKLQDQISSAHSDSFRDRAYGWLSELEDKISKHKEFMQRIEEWINEDEKKLTE